MATKKANPKLNYLKINMKTVGFFFTVVGLSVLSFGLSFAEPPSNQSPSQPSGQEPNENHPSIGQPANPVQDKQTDGNKVQTDGYGQETSDTGDQTDNKHSPPNDGRPNPGKASQSGPVKIRPSNQPPTLPVTNLTQPAPPALARSAPITNAGSPVTKPGSSSPQLVRLPGNGGAAALLPTIPQKRTVTTASIGGWAMSSAKHSAAAINGKATKRKP